VDASLVRKRPWLAGVGRGG